MAGGARTSDIGTVVRRVFREQRRGPALTLNTLREHWPAIVGGHLAARTRPGRLAGGTLWIEAPDACWSYELQFFRSEILNAVRTFCDAPAVKEIRFTAGGEGRPSAAEAAAPPPPDPDPAEPGPQVVEGSTVEGSTVEGRAPENRMENLLERAAEPIGDPELRAAFRRALGKRREPLP